MSSWERGYGDFVDAARPRHAAPDPVAPGHGAADGRPRVGGRLATSWPRRARSCAASSPGWPSAAGRRPPAPSSSSSSSATPTRRRGSKGYRDLEPANLYNVDYSMLGTARVEPLIRRIRNSMTAAGHAGRELEGRVQLRPARDQLPLRRRARRPPTTTRSTRTAPRRSPPRRACRSPSWPSSTSARATRATSTSRCASEDGGDAVRRRARDASTASSPASSPALRELTLLFAPARQLLQALRRGLVRADRGRLGQRQPHLLDAGGRPRAGRCGWRTGCPAPTSTRTWRSRAMIAAGLHGIDDELELEPAVRGQRLRVRQAARAATSMYDARDLFAGSEVAREAFGQEVVDHYLNRAPRRARRPSRPRSPTGSASAASSDCRDAVSRPAIGICASLETVPLGRVGRARPRSSPSHYSLAVQRAGGRRRAARCPTRPTRAEPGRAARPARRRAHPGAAGPTSTRRATARSRIPKTRGTWPARDQLRARAGHARSSATCRCWGSAAGCSCSTWPTAARSTSTCPSRRPRRPRRTRPASSCDHARPPRARLAGRARGGRRAHGGARLPPPGRARGGGGAAADRLGRSRRRHRRGDRAARTARSRSACSGIPRKTSEPRHRRARRGCKKHP